MPEPIRIASDHEAIEVDLWGALFYTQRITRTRQKMLTDVQRQLSALEGDDDDRAVELLGQMLDALIVPEDGKRKQASKHITEKWQADDLTVPELESFLDRLLEATRPI